MARASSAEIRRRSTPLTVMVPDTRSTVRISAESSVLLPAAARPHDGRRACPGVSVGTDPAQRGPVAVAARRDPRRPPSAAPRAGAADRRARAPPGSGLDLLQPPAPPRAPRSAAPRPPPAAAPARTTPATSGRARRSRSNPRRARLATADHDHDGEPPCTSTPAASAVALTRARPRSSPASRSSAAAAASSALPGRAVGRQIGRPVHEVGGAGGQIGPRGRQPGGPPSGPAPPSPPGAAPSRDGQPARQHDGGERQQERRDDHGPVTPRPGAATRRSETPRPSRSCTASVSSTIRAQQVGAHGARSGPAGMSES